KKVRLGIVVLWKCCEPAFHGAIALAKVFRLLGGCVRTGCRRLPARGLAHCQKCGVDVGLEAPFGCSHFAVDGGEAQSRGEAVAGGDEPDGSCCYGRLLMCAPSKSREGEHYPFAYIERNREYCPNIGIKLVIGQLKRKPPVHDCGAEARDENGACCDPSV